MTGSYRLRSPFVHLANRLPGSQLFERHTLVSVGLGQTRILPASQGVVHALVGHVSRDSRDDHSRDLEVVGCERRGGFLLLRRYSSGTCAFSTSVTSHLTPEADRVGRGAA